LLQGFEIRTEWLPEMQEAQEDCLHMIPNCGCVLARLVSRTSLALFHTPFASRHASCVVDGSMIVTTDITADVNDIHPPNKKDVGRRLARWALAKDYGQEDVVYSGPTLVQTT
jgi:hypothetical protein